MIYRVACHGRAVDQAIVNVWHVTSISGNEINIANGFVSSVVPALRVFLNDEYMCDDVVVTNVTTLEQYTQSINQPGQNNAADMLPPQNAAVLSLKTGLAGKKYRGRSFIGPLSENDQIAGTWNSTLLAAMDNLGDALMSDWPSLFTGSLVIYHKGDGTSTPVNSYVSRPTVYTQRRRTIGRGG